MKLFIWGAGGHGKVVADILLRANRAVAAFVDSNPTKRLHFNLPVVSEEELPKQERFECIVAVGVNERRAALSELIRTNFPNAEFINAIHPQAMIASEVRLGRGVVVAAGAIVGPDSEIGDHCVINTGASVDHDCRIGEFSSAAPGVTIGGGARIGRMTYIALGARVAHGMTIGEHTVIGAGSTVVRPIGDRVVAYGSPCKVIRERREEDRYL